MPLYTRSQFANYINKSMAYVSTYITRGKIVLSGDYIDDNQSDNKELINKLREKEPPKKEVKKERYKDKPQELPPKPKEDTSNNVWDLNTEKKKLEVEKLRKENRILKAKAEKIEGALIPTEMVKSVMIEHSESIKIAYNDATENLIVVIAGKYKLTTVQVSEIRKELVVLINKAVTNAVYSTKKKLKSIVAEYSDIKGVGEHD